MNRWAPLAVLNRSPGVGWPTVAFLAGVVAAVVGAEAAVSSGWVSGAAVARPTEIPAGFARLVEDGFVGRDVATTLRLAAVSVLTGFPAGVILAAAIRGAGRARPVADVTVDFVRSIPITALLPVFGLVFGFGDRNKIAIGAFSAATVALIASLEGLDASFERYRKALHLYKPRWRDRWFRIALPDAAPSLISALRLATSSALVLVVVAEMFVGTQAGVGKRINDLSYTDDRPAQYAAVLTVGLIGYLLNVATRSLYRMFSRPRSR